mmetsp:Transcript_31558/g.65922  ORF Transcript_31558/g.65922 Transcript_31558/m.65922 type:complete len:126 (+) Transcript_31558:142-519(+)
MGAACSKSDATPVGDEGGTLGVMFNRFDKEKKGYISLKNLEEMMKDDKMHFQGKDADHIMGKYGTDGKMNFQQFSTWWNSTYTTYNDGAIANLVDEVQTEQRMEPIAETELPGDQHITNKAVGRS